VLTAGVIWVACKNIINMNIQIDENRTAVRTDDMNTEIKINRGVIG